MTRRARKEKTIPAAKDEAAPRTPAAALRRFIAAAYQAVGVPPEDADIAAGLMLESDLSGADGHGVFRLPQYIRRIKAGGMEVRPRMAVHHGGAAAALVDGGNGLGALVMKKAADTAIEKAREAGVAWVGVRNGNHAGAASVYARMPLPHDMVGLYLAIGNANHLPPWGGIDMLLSTNPIAIAVPGLEELEIVLDMATTVAAYGKVKVAAQRGETMPEGWMIDREGRPLTDPKRADDGFLLPIGGYKGFGLALMFGFLAGTLNGAAFGKDVVDFNKDDKTPTNTGQAIVAVKISAFGDVGEFKRRVDTAAREMRGSARLPGVDAIRLPGEQSHAKRQERARAGIPVPPALRRSLDALADGLGIAKLP